MFCQSNREQFEIESAHADRVPEAPPPRGGRAEEYVFLTGRIGPAIVLAMSTRQALPHMVERSRSGNCLSKKRDR